MALNITPKFTVNDIKKLIQAKIDKIEEAVIKTLNVVGETFVKNARENANFKDRTGNLRSSIGFVIMKNGEVVNENFELSKQGVDPVTKKPFGTDRETGKQKAIQVAKEVSANFPKGLVLIVVAGMEYAAAVESKNFDVITGSSLLAEDELRRTLKMINEEIPKMQ